MVVNLSLGFNGTPIPGARSLGINGTASAGGAGGALCDGNLSSTPVPEPETYTLTPAGLGVVGLVAARRRRGG